MVTLIDGVVNEFPLPKELPPVDDAYQFNVPALPVAFRTTVPTSQREPGVEEVIVGPEFMLAKTEVLDDGEQPERVAST